MTILLLVPTASYAYAPGSVGYLYESCKAALENSKDAAAFDATYCGGFVEGYVAGVASNAAAIPPPSEKDPCHDDKKAAFDHINGRFCANLPDYKSASLSDIQSIAPKAADIFFRWIAYLEKKKGEAALTKSASSINEMIGAGEFCDALAENKNGTPVSALKNFSLLSYIEIERAKTLEQKYQSCKRDYDSANAKTNPFRASRCGAEITGYVAGLLSGAQAIAKAPRPSRKCEKPIRRLIRALDVSETMCVSGKTSAASIAKKFLARADELKSGNDITAMPGYGAAGYQPVFFGLMCR